MFKLLTSFIVINLVGSSIALTCDPPTQNVEVVGRNNDGQSLLLRNQDTQLGWIDLKILNLKDSSIAKTIPIIKPNDPKEKRQQIRKTRWEAAEKELKAKGFKIDPKFYETKKFDGPELDLKNHIKLFTQEVFKDSSNEQEPPQVRIDLVIQKDQVKKTVEEGIIGGGFSEAQGIENRVTLVGGYYFSEDGTLLLMTGSCAGIQDFIVRKVPVLIKAAGLK